MKIQLEENAIMPTKAYETDAGFDIYSPYALEIPARSNRVINTGVHIDLPKNTVGMLKSKSGLNVKHGIVSEGVIDVGYSGAIAVKLYNHSYKDYIVHKGDKITQLVILPLADVGELELVDKLNGGERGGNGFGSSGR